MSAHVIPQQPETSWQGFGPAKDSSMNRSLDGRSCLLGKMRWMRSKLPEYKVSEHFVHVFVVRSGDLCHRSEATSEHLAAALQDGRSSGFLGDSVTALRLCPRNLLGLTRKKKKQEIGESCRRIGNHVRLLVKSIGGLRSPKQTHLSILPCHHVRQREACSTSHPGA